MSCARPALTLAVAATLLTGCHTPSTSGPQPGGGGGATVKKLAQPDAGPRGAIEGDVETVKRKRHLRIWGTVERLRQGKHGELPPLSTTASGGVGDPVTEIVNGTTFKLTIWFAGKCSHQVDVPPKKTVTAVFCAGAYNLAAMVEDSSYLPLVRENQEFETGMQYQLDFFVKQAPH